MPYARETSDYIGNQPPQRLKIALGAYARAVKAMGQAPSVDAIPGAICDALASKDEFLLAAVGMALPEDPERLTFVGASGRAISYLPGLEILLSADKPEGRGPTATSIRTARPVVMAAMESDPSFSPWRARALHFGIQSSISLPFPEESGLVGALVLYSSNVDAFSQIEIETFNALAGELAAAMSAADRQSGDSPEEAPFDFEAMINATTVGFLIIDAGEAPGTVLDANPAYCQLSGYSREQLRGMHLSELNPTLTRERIIFNTRAVLRLGTFTFTSMHRTKDGRDVPLDVTIGHAASMGNRAFAFLHDRSEQVEAERKLLEVTRTSRQQRKAVMDAHRMLVSVSESTLRQIGSDLHDDVGQMIAGASMLSSSLAGSLSFAEPRLAEKAELVANILGKAANRLRALSKGLYPVGLDGSSLKTMIEDFAVEFGKYSSMLILVDVADDCCVELPADKLLHVYRILQEASSNIARHSKATSMSIACSHKQGRLRIAVTDNGIGIPAQRLKGIAGGIGLATMRARADEIGATLSITRAKVGGTCVEISLPFEGAQKHGI